VLEKNDILVAKTALQDAKIASQNLSTFFGAFREGLTKVMIDPRFKWPKMPDGHEIRELYGYKRP
jgi:hypothetical protein